MITTVMAISKGMPRYSIRIGMMPRQTAHIIRPWM